MADSNCKQRRKRRQESSKFFIHVTIHDGFSRVPGVLYDDTVSTIISRYIVELIMYVSAAGEDVVVCEM